MQFSALTMVETKLEAVHNGAESFLKENSYFHLPSLVDKRTSGPANTDLVLVLVQKHTGMKMFLQNWFHSIGIVLFSMNIYLGHPDPASNAAAWMLHLFSNVIQDTSTAPFRKMVTVMCNQGN